MSLAHGAMAGSVISDSGSSWSYLLIFFGWIIDTHRMTMGNIYDPLKGGHKMFSIKVSLGSAVTQW